MSDSRLTASHDELESMFETPTGRGDPSALIVESVSEDLGMLAHHNELPEEFVFFLMRARDRLRFALGLPITAEGYSEVATVARLKTVEDDQ